MEGCDVYFLCSIFRFSTYNALFSSFTFLTTTLFQFQFSNYNAFFSFSFNFLITTLFQFQFSNYNAFSVSTFLSRLGFVHQVSYISIWESKMFDCPIDKVTAVGFEPTPLRTGALSQRLRPLGQTVLALRNFDKRLWHVGGFMMLCKNVQRRAHRKYMIRRFFIWYSVDVKSEIRSG